MIYQNIKTLKEQVKYWLADHVENRNDDARLIQEVCSHHGYNPIEKASSIERCRRFWQSKGKYLPTNERIARNRKMNMDEWRIAMGYPTRITSGTPNPSWTPPSKIKKPEPEVESTESNQPSLL